MNNSIDVIRVLAYVQLIKFKIFIIFNPLLFVIAVFDILLDNATSVISYDFN